MPGSLGRLACKSAQFTLKKKTRAAALTSNLPTTSLSSIKLQSALPDMLRNAPLGSRITI